MDEQAKKTIQSIINGLSILRDDLEGVEANTLTSAIIALTALDNYVDAKIAQGKNQSAH